MPGELKNDPLTIVVGVGDRRCSKDAGGICAKGEEGNTGGSKEHGLKEAVGEANLTEEPGEDGEMIPEFE